jgi:hypothetical protein
MYWNPGDPFKPQEPLTATARNARITSFARGWVTVADSRNISFYLDRGIPGSGWIEAQTDLATFGVNFVPDHTTPPNKAYARSQHYLKLFPRDFF